MQPKPHTSQLTSRRYKPVVGPIRTPTERNPRTHFSINTLTEFKAERKKYLIKYYIIQKRFSLKILLFMYLANFIFVVSHLKIHPAVHLNTSKALTSLWSKTKAY